MSLHDLNRNFDRVDQMVHSAYLLILRCDSGGRTTGANGMLGAIGRFKYCRLGLIPKGPAVIREYACGDDESLGVQALLEEAIGGWQRRTEWLETLHEEKTECLGVIVAITIESVGDVKIRPVGMICRRITGNAMRDKSGHFSLESRGEAFVGE